MFWFFKKKEHEIYQNENHIFKLLINEMVTDFCDTRLLVCFTSK